MLHLSHKEAVQFLADSGLKIIAASEKGVDLYNNINYNGPIAIVMGAEDTGVSNDILRKAANIVKIPLFGKIESLNVAVAAGILLFEAVGQKEKI